MTVPLSALLVSAFLALPPTDAAAEDAGLPAPEVTFVISTGFWQEPQDDAQAVPIQRGYYKLIALRQPDGTAQIHLQQIASTPEGPRVLTSAELEEFSDLRAYVTDIRPDSSSGVSSQPGLFATVYLKTDPAAPETESWTVLIDDLGDVRVERATN
ncbi:hypothetical protein [Rhizobium sp. RU20A]|uniref:hypothetical protein n=1 Tax=Rhizobium sp. RU20A TaxID=1907412 RepID=UPI00122C3F16|nr:hypothetical protein [Rhizobium sp. RU20A]